MRLKNPYHNVTTSSSDEDLPSQTITPTDTVSEVEPYRTTQLPFERHVQEDVIHNYTEKYSLRYNSSNYRQFIYGNVYTGKYRAQPLSALGYQKEHKKNKHFIQFINRLALTDHCRVDHLFLHDPKRLLSTETIYITNLFTDIQNEALRDLRNLRREKINALAEKFKQKNPSLSATTLEKLITDIVTMEQETDDYLAARKKIKKALTDNTEIQLKKLQWLEIIKLRETLLAKKNRTDGYLKSVKKDFNHYFLAINSKKRIAKNENKENPFDKSYVIANFEDALKEKKAKTLKQKELHEKIATIVGANVGFGEGVVAAVALMSAIASLGPIACIMLGVTAGLSGAAFNNYLVRDDTYAMLNALRVNKILDKMPGDPVRKQILKDVAIFFGSCALSTGFVYGALSAMQLYYGLLLPIFTLANISGSAAPFLGLAIALWPVFLTAAGLSSIYFFVITDLIKNQKWISIKNYFRRHYLDLGWSEMTIIEKFSQGAICFFDFLKLMLVFSIAAVVSIISFRLFHQKCVNIVSAAASINSAQLVATIITSISTTICGIFNVKKINDIFTTVTLRHVLLLALPNLFLSIHDGLYFLARAITALVLFTPLTVAAMLRYILLTVPTGSVQLVLAAINTTIQLVFNSPKYFMGLAILPVVLTLFVVGAVLHLVRAALALSLYTTAGIVEKITFNHVNGLNNVNELNLLVSNTISRLFTLAGFITHKAQQFSGWYEGKSLQAGGYAAVAENSDDEIEQQPKRIGHITNCVDEFFTNRINQIASLRMGLYQQTKPLATATFDNTMDARQWLFTRLSFFSKPRELFNQSAYKHFADKDFQPAKKGNAAEHAPTGSPPNREVEAKVHNGVKGLGNSVCGATPALIVPNSAPQAAMFSLASGFPPALRAIAFLCAYLVSSAPNISAAQSSIRNAGRCGV